MQIQLNTDNNLTGSSDLAMQVERDIRGSLDRFAERITRVEVHLNDLNGEKTSGDDKRCMMEARVAGLQPISVNHQAPTLALAISGASDKLSRALDRHFGKLDSDRRSGLRQAKDDSA